MVTLSNVSIKLNLTANGLMMEMMIESNRDGGDDDEQTSWASWA